MTQKKSILITGASSGMGQAAALALKERKYEVFATARKASDLDELEKSGLNAIEMDVRHTESIQKGISSVLQQTGGTLYGLFNNAGFMQAGAIEDLSREMLEAQFETNVFGAMEVIRAVLPAMRQQGYGRIIQNSSILGLITIPYYGAYNASKYALEAFSRTLRQELRNTGIFVSNINPGPVVTNLRQNAYTHFKNSREQFTRSIHQNTYQEIERGYFNEERKPSSFTKGPEAIVKPLIHALESAHPKRHYFIGAPASVIAHLQKFLPESFIDWILRTRR